MHRIRPYLQGAVGFIVLTSLFYGALWIRNRYAEFTFMKAVTVAVLCKDFRVDAVKMGVQCQAPPPTAPAGNASPAAPTP